MSASAPAGIANRNIGKLFATCTIDTRSGSGSRFVMSQPEATLYIHAPMFETTVAAQIIVNARWRNGAHALEEAGRVALAGGVFAEGVFTPVNRDFAVFPCPGNR